MHSRRYDWDEAKIARCLKEGRGRGTGPDYRPWLTVADVPSRGLSRRPWCPMSGRQLHLLSRAEFFTYLDLWWDETVSEVREQYPLPRHETTAIARRRGIKHPCDVRSKAILVQTTDMLATVRSGGATSYRAVAVKTVSDLTNTKRDRTLEKMDLERTYWRLQGVEWRLVLDVQVRTRRTANLLWLFEARSQVEPALQDRVAALEASLAGTISAASQVPARVTCSLFDARRGLAPGTGLMLLRAMLRRKSATVDLWSPRIQDEPGSSFSWPGIQP